MKNLKNRSIMLLVSGLIALTTFSHTARAQEIPGALNFGFDAGLNKYYGDFTDSHFGLGGDLFIRYNFTDWISLRAAYNAGVIGYKSTAASIADEHALFGIPSSTNGLGADGGPEGSMNHIRYGGWDLMGEINFFPDQTFVPFFLGGIEALNFEPDDATPSPLEGNAAAAYSKNVIGGVLGVGFDMFISQKVTFNGQVLMHLTGTDWLDDYSSGNTASANAQANGATQVGNSNYRQDAYLTFGLGFSYNLFTPPQPEPTPAPATGNTTNVYNNNYYTTSTILQHDTMEYTVYNTDTEYVQSPTDTVYLTNPKINTIFNFPGTLFVVNSDQLNSNVPNNLEHLYHIKSLVEQCPNLKVEIDGFASEEGTSAHNQDLSERRANSIKTWLIAQGVSPDKISRTVGYGDTRPAVKERTDVSPAELEAERTQNRRIAVMVVQTCQ